MATAEQWRLGRVNHVNVIAEDFRPFVEHLERVGFVLDRENPDLDGVDFALMTLGGVLFGLFMPKVGEGGQGRLLERYGNFYNGLEYQVPDVAAARRVCEQRDVRIIIDHGQVFHTYPGSTFGVSFEIYAGDFDHLAQPPGYWEHDHPMRLTGLARLTIAVENMDAAVGRLRELTDAPTIATIARPRAAASGVQLQVGHAVWELLEPAGDGPVADFLGHYGERMRSVVFGTRDLGAVEPYLTGRGFDLLPGDADDSLVIDPAQNRNLRFEFVQVA